MASTEIQFAQRLASNERKIRDKAIKNLKKYLEIRSNSKKQFAEEDFLKIWKGLHYCLWMQDKPLIQEELVQKMTTLVHTLANADQTFLFIKVFFQTEMREWQTIDKWRLDKFMMLIRQFLRQSLHYLQNNSWKTDYIEKLTILFQETFLDPQNTRISLGFRMYFNSIFLEELKRTGLKYLMCENFCLCLESYIYFIQHSKQKEVIIDIIKKIFDPVISDSLKLRAESPLDSKTDDKTRLVDGRQVSEWLADKLFVLGKDPECSSWHRNQFYVLVKKIRDNLDRKVSTARPDYDNDDNSSISEKAETFDNVVADLKQKNTRQNVKGKIEKSSSSRLEGSSDNIEKDEDITKDINTSRGSKKLKRKIVTNDDLSINASVVNPTKKSKKNPESTESDSVKEKERKKSKISSVKKSGIKQKVVKSEKKKMIASTPVSSAKKKVVFNMKNNTALKFKKGMAVSPLPAYIPSKQPDQGILKSPASPASITPSSAKRKNGKLVHSQDSAKASKIKSTPVSVKTRRLTRLTASDFF